MKNSKILITGAQGFLGGHVYTKLLNKQYNNVVKIDQEDFNLLNEVEIEKLFTQINPEIIIHCAGVLGGIDFIKQFPGEVFYKNAKMNLLLMEYSRIYGVKKFIQIGTASSYSDNAKIPFNEKDLWKDLPEDIIRPYSIAKIIQIIQQEAYKKQYNFNAIHLLLANLYGPKDSFCPPRHVIPTMIKKISEAKKTGQKKLVFWGNGNQEREFLYIEDAAEAIVLAMEKYNSINPINIGSGDTIKIKNLAQLLKDQIGFKGDILWDTNKPTGQIIRQLDNSKAKKAINFEAKTPLEIGLEKTISWYKTTKLK
jgi:GDP-L-fucose synthase